MLIAFRSKAATEILMLVEHARVVLELSGKAGNVAAESRGTFTVEQLPAAIVALEQAVAAVPVAAQNDAADASTEDDATEDTGSASRVSVSLRQRAFPLLDMLRSAQKKAVTVSWEPAA